MLPDSLVLDSPEESADGEDAQLDPFQEFCSETEDYGLSEKSELITGLSKGTTEPKSVQKSTKLKPDG